MVELLGTYTFVGLILSILMKNESDLIHLFKLDCLLAAKSEHTFKTLLPASENENETEQGSYSLETLLSLHNCS